MDRLDEAKRLYEQLAKSRYGPHRANLNEAMLEITPDLFALAAAAERALELLVYLGRTDLCVDDLRACIARVRGRKP